MTHTTVLVGGVHMVNNLRFVNMAAATAAAFVALINYNYSLSDC